MLHVARIPTALDLPALVRGFDLNAVSPKARNKRRDRKEHFEQLAGFPRDRGDRDRY